MRREQQSKNRIVSITGKITAVFSFLILVSNLASNYVMLQFNRVQQTALQTELLKKDLLAVNNIMQSQYEVYEGGEAGQTLALNNLIASARAAQTEAHSLTLAVHSDGTLLFAASEMEIPDSFSDTEALAQLLERLQDNILNDKLFFNVDVGAETEKFFGIYHYNRQWDVFLIRADPTRVFFRDLIIGFLIVTAFVLFVTVVSLLVGIYLLRYTLRYLPLLTEGIQSMHKEQQIGKLDMTGTPDDEIGYLGLAFNALADTIDNLLSIFRKFTTRDVVQKAYHNHAVNLAGEKTNLTILFTDIRNFTGITEHLGTDIIKLLNMHYENAIRGIYDYDGDIGSIIGDALLALFGTIDSDENKSVQAILAGYKILEAAKELRTEMHKRREEILRGRGTLVEEEEHVYQSVLLNVGIGIDGGEMFYGNIGSSIRMVSTVIGDNVNNASRLEGLTPKYQVPMLCSEYVRADVPPENNSWHFLEIDQVLVKGKHQAQKIFWPIERKLMNREMQNNISNFSSALEQYYAGKWPAAATLFQKSNLPVGEIFAKRIKNQKVPKDWNGVWTQTEK